MDLDIQFALFAQTREGTTMPDDAPNPVTAKQEGKYYLLYFNGHSDEEVSKWFEERNGYSPEQIIRTGGGTLAGPLAKGPKDV